jgi:predicted acetyltransferase
MLKMVDESNIECYKNLSQNYEAEFSPLTGKHPDINGLYSITELNNVYKGYLYYLENGIPAGIVVVDTGRSVLDIAEFYVIPTERRNGIGRNMASEIFNLYLGDWQVRQISGADYAYNFWISVIKEYTNDNFTDSVEKDAEWCTVRIQRFSTGR